MSESVREDRVSYRDTTHKKIHFMISFLSIRINSSDYLNIQAPEVDVDA